ncbi:MAG: class I SAM-dependent methyltransferase [Candidatus Brocadiales bacterium]|nr:class I SAM-dependent methyltransferase [Candidatus Bathyanammoxibius sp.]
MKFAMRIKKMLRLLFASTSERRHSLVGPSHLWEMKRDFQIRFLKHVGLKPEHYLLDLGCGTLRGGIPLIEYLQEQHYYGIEVRANVLDEGKKELHEANLEYRQPVLVCAENIALLRLEKMFDLIWAYSVLIHTTDTILSDTLGFVRAHLNSTGYFYANVSIGERKDETWSEGFPVVTRPFDFYVEVARQAGLNVIDTGTIESLGFKSGQQSHDEKRMLKFYKA